MSFNVLFKWHFSYPLFPIERSFGREGRVDISRVEDLKVSINRQTYFGKDGLYFCGFWIGPTGVIREIASDAKKITKDIAKKEKLS